MARPSAIGGNLRPNTKAIGALGAEMAHATQVAFSSDVEVAEGQLLDRAVATVVRELSKAAAEPTFEGDGTKLTELGRQ